ncbi:hypothetical protein ACMFMF_000591 [Clarireedia jacksonii]
MRLLLKQLILQLIRQPNRMRLALGCRINNISLPTTPKMHALALHTRSQRGFGNAVCVVAFSGCKAWGADVGSAAATGAECAVAVVTSWTLTHDFTVGVAVGELVRLLDQAQWVGGWNGIG